MDGDPSESLREALDRSGIWHPSRMRLPAGSLSGGVALLNHRLITGIPPGCTNPRLEALRWSAMVDGFVPWLDCGCGFGHDADMWEGAFQPPAAPQAQLRIPHVQPFE